MVALLGDVISKGGISNDPPKMEVVLKAERSINVMDARSFLGLDGYCQHFVEIFYLEPLR